MKSRVAILLVVLLVLSASSFTMARERSETLVYGGGLWSAPNNWNPLHWDAVTGTIGLVYETLFHFSPVTTEFKPWLAESGEWTSDTVYELKLRSGIQWTDGQPLTADDVKFTYTIARENDLPYSPIWRWLEDIEVSSPTEVKFIFNNPSYHEWQIELYSRPILPEHIWSEVPGEDLLVIANRNPMGSGAYLAAETGPDRMVWDRNDDWWGREIFGTPAPKHLVNLVVNENNIALGMLMQRQLDLSNYFIPGVPAVKGPHGLTTWFEGPPYMLPSNTAILFLNSSKAPLDDVRLRQAMAYAIDPAVIVSRVFEEQVTVSNPTGLFGGWEEFLSDEVVEEYGFHYDRQQAEEMLDAAGYVDANGDGWRQTPSGEDMQFDIIVPSGWTDWMESIRIIAQHLRAVGINANPAFPDYSVYFDRLQDGTFDMAIGNDGSNVSATPYSYWNWIANHDIDREVITEGNWGRYRDQELFDLIAEFNRVQPDTDEALQIAADIQRILLEAMPSIPLWQNGLWAQSTSQYWTNWPTEDNPIGYPCTWGGMWEFGGMEMLINLEPVQ